MGKDKGEEEKEEQKVEQFEEEEEDTPYPYYVFFILGNEFCERYAYYGMRSILVIFLTYFLGYSKDTSTIIYHLYIALCYFFPLIGGVIADAWLGKFMTIFILSIVYFFGMVLMTMSAVPQLNGGGTEPGDINRTFALIALLVVAMGTGGIKPCVSALGGDQFKDTAAGRKQLSGFFSLFYASINAGSLLSTFVSPILRETQCLGRSDCYAVAFMVPACLMFVAIIAFVLGKRWYIVKKSDGNVFTEFCGATWTGLRGKCKSKEKKEHFLDYAKGKYPNNRIRDFKYIYPLMVMYLPLPFFWSLFSMQGSRWTLTATQTNGWCGSVKIRPDQMQIMNPIMILAFLPLFQYGVYPLIEKCGIRMTSLRRMSAGQVTTALAFVVSGFIQLTIDKELTPIPDYGNQNSFMVVNGYHEAKTITVTSEEYWNFNDQDGKPHESSFDIDSTSASNWRTPTSSWIRTDLPDNTKISIGNEEYTLNGPESSDKNINIPAERITGDMCFKKDGKDICQPYESSYEKSGSMRVRFLLLNPTDHFVLFKLFDPMEGSTGASVSLTKEMVVEKYDTAINNSTEYDRGIYKVQAYLWKSRPAEVTKENPYYDTTTADLHCETDFVRRDAENDDFGDTDNFVFTTGSIFSLMATTDGAECTVKYAQDAKGNTLNIFAMLPQYIVITMGEVMNSVTGLEFSYTQAPKSMKSVVQSFWLLTTCVGNIIDIFLVEIKMHPTQAGEYFILAMIMLGASSIFILLSIFYYEYIPEDAFAKDEKEDIKDETEKGGEANRAFDDENEENEASL